MTDLRSIEDMDFRLDEIAARLKQINAENDGRRFPDPVREEWNLLNAEQTDIEQTRAEVVKRKERLRHLAANPNATEQASMPGAPSLVSSLNPWGQRERLDVLSGADVRSRAVDAVSRTALGEDAKQLAARLCGRSGVEGRAAAEWVLATSDPAYERAFGKLLADPTTGHRSFDTAEQQAYTRVRAMSLDPTTAGGGLTVPFQLDPTMVLSSDGSVDAYRAVCRRVTISGTNTWKGTPTDGVTGEWLGEGVEAADASPMISEVEIATHKAAAWVPYSVELGEDFAGLRTQLGRLFADGKTQLEAGAFTFGTGSGQPTGLVTALGSGQAVTTGAAAYVADDAYALLAGVPPRFRQRSAVLAEHSTITATRRFTTDTEPEIVPASFDRWLGRPLHETSTLADSVATGNVLAIAGDFSQAVIVDRVGLSVELVPHVFGTNNRPTGQRGLWMHWRVGFDVLVPNALRKLVVG